MRLHAEPAVAGAAGSRADTLLVLLTPAEARLEDYREQGFLADLCASGLAVDVLLAEPSYEEVLSWQVPSLLQAQVIAPALAAGYRQLWLAGISLGAFNALLYAARYAEALGGTLAGLLLLAPYPGTRDVLREIEAAGGPLPWAEHAPSDAGDERLWWRWLCQKSALVGRRLEHAPAIHPAIHFATGSDDRFITGQRLIASLLPPAQVHIAPGGHDWPTWRTLWVAWLDAGHLIEKPECAST